jgi:hypothetical protein
MVNNSQIWGEKWTLTFLRPERFKIDRKFFLKICTKTHLSETILKITRKKWFIIYKGECIMVEVLFSAMPHEPGDKWEVIFKM